jgi:hypothetical protein
LDVPKNFLNNINGKNWMCYDQSTFEGKVVCEFASLCDVPHPYGWLQVNLYMQDKRCPKAWDTILCEEKEIWTTMPLWSQGCQPSFGFELNTTNQQMKHTPMFVCHSTLASPIVGNSGFDIISMPTTYTPNIENPTYNCKST